MFVNDSIMKSVHQNIGCLKQLQHYGTSAHPFNGRSLTSFGMSTPQTVVTRPRTVIMAITCSTVRTSSSITVRIISTASIDPAKNAMCLQTTSKQTVLLWSPYGIGQTIIFSCCNLFFLLLFFSSPNLSRRRLDVCHTSTHGVALVWI